MVALKLVSQGKLSLDEPLYKYWTDPDIASDPGNKKITPRLILSHQTGFANWRWMNGGKKTEVRILPRYPLPVFRGRNGVPLYRP